jgi:hypothetical protein
VPDFPKLFEDIKKKKFTLLWRGGRDGFGKGDFHSRCDGRANTLTVILDTDGNIFGGFTPVEWDSTSFWKADPSLRSFLFTLKNPHNVAARRFALRAEEKHRAIYGYVSTGPNFYDICLRDNCNTNTGNNTYDFGHSYTNDSGLGGITFFTGSRRFQVREIEVFEITN